MPKSVQPKAGISQRKARVSKRLGAECTHLNEPGSTAILSSKPGTSDGPNSDRLADIVLPADAKPRQIFGVRVATVFDRSCKRQIKKENWSATNEAIATRIKQDEKFVRRLRDAREPLRVADVYSLPQWAFDDLIADLYNARGLANPHEVDE